MCEYILLRVVNFIFAFRIVLIYYYCDGMIIINAMGTLIYH